MAGSNINNRHTFWVESLTNQPNTEQQIRHVDMVKKKKNVFLRFREAYQNQKESESKVTVNMMNVVFGIVVWVFHKLLPIYWHLPQNRLEGLQWVPKRE